MPDRWHVDRTGAFVFSLALDEGTPGCSGRRMWRHIPKITVLAAIGFMMLIFYVTQWNLAPTAGKAAAPNVVYINQGMGAGNASASRP